jgi:hypothetical protein
LPDEFFREYDTYLIVLNISTEAPLVSGTVRFGGTTQITESVSRRKVRKTLIDYAVLSGPREEAVCLVKGWLNSPRTGQEGTIVHLFCRDRLQGSSDSHRLADRMALRNIKSGSADL